MDYPYNKRKRVWGPHTNKKGKISVIKEEAGYMTVFGALVCLVFAGFLYLCIDASLIYQAKARCVMAQTGLGEHLLANYNSPLAKEYNLYFLDPALGKENLEKRASTYYETLFSTDEKGLFSGDLWNLREKETQIELFGTMQEKDCAYFKKQIRGCMKDKATKDVILQMFDATAKEIKEKSNQTEETIGELEQRESGQEGSDTAGDTLLPSEPAGEESSSGEAGSSNPLKKIKNILDYGILGYVTDVEHLSKHRIDSASLPFQNLKADGLKISMDILKNLGNVKDLVTKQNIDQLGENLVDRGVISLYVADYFGCYGAEKVRAEEDGFVKKERNPYTEEDHSAQNRKERSPEEKEEGKTKRLLYEREYILGGHSSDKENLEYVVNRLVLLRFGMNAAYAFTDVTLNEQAYALAAGITGLAGVPELVEVARGLILAAVSLIESISDVEDLLENRTVPIVKTDASWKTSVGGDVTGSGKTDGGLSYEEYLMILVLLDSDQNRICLRMQNLMELHIQQEEPEFDITRCMSGMRMITRTAVKTIFSGKEYIVEEVGIYEY